MPDTTPSTQRDTSRRRLLLGGSLAAAVTGYELVARPAAAAPATQAWLMGGNTAVNTDGTNYLGPKNVAPLVFKTAATSGSPVEQMRITPSGQVGIGTPAPSARLMVREPSALAIYGVHSS